MRRFHDCIDLAEGDGTLSREEAASLRDAHNRNTGGQGSFGFDEAAAARATFDAFEAEQAMRRRQKLLAVAAQQQALFDMRGYRDPLGRANLNDGARALYNSTPFQSKSPGLAEIREDVRGKLHSSLAQAFEKFERNILGETRNKALLSDVVDALFGKTNVPEGAKQIAQAWRIAAERARLMFNKAGGHIGFREDWGLPQGHDWELVATAAGDGASREANMRAWIDFVMPLLDRAKMINGVTGRPFNDAELELALVDTFEAIASEGGSRMEPSGSRPGKSIGNRRADPRFLILKDGAAWRSYMERFGEGDPFKVMMDYIDGMSRDIALMQRFGPNPNAGMEYVRQVIDIEAKRSMDPKTKDRAKFVTAELDAMAAQFTGAASLPANKLFASTMGEVRQWLVAAQLGSAMLSAVSDVGFQQITAAVNGLQGWKVAARHLALMDPRNAVDRETAIALGLIADEASQIASAQQRHFGEAWGSGLSQRFADGVLKASGLSAWTQAGRWAFGMEFLAMLGRDSDKAFDALHPKVRATLERYGFDAGHWDGMRGAIEDRSGARFLNPVKVADERLGQRLGAMIRSETNFAVPTVTLYGKAAFAGMGRPGTIAGELTRSFMMYKNFGVTLVMTHGRRMAMQSTPLGKIGYGGALIGTATMLGAVSLQLKEISKGRDPQPMMSDRFLLAAMAQGGGFGIFGDFLFSDVNRFGGGLADTFAGPVVGAASDLLGFGMSVKDASWRALFGGEGPEPNPGGQLARLMERYTPGGSLWYLRLAYQRAVIDQLGEMADPNWNDRQARIERAARDKGQGMWWRPARGEPLAYDPSGPSRLPDLGNVAAPAPQ